MYLLIASDLDGTLLLPGDTFGAFTKSVIHSLNHAGHHIVLATGRHQTDVESLLDSQSLPVHLITSNGARISSACGGLALSEELPASVVQTLLEETRGDADLTINLYCQSSWLMSREDENLKDFSQNPAFQPVICASESLPLTAVQKVFFFQRNKDHGALLRLQSRLNQLLGDQISTVFTFPWCLEVMTRDVSKGNALKQLADFLNVPVQACIAFGDGLNDADMLSGVGKGVLMGNAHAELMQALPDAEVIGPCTDEAVAHYLWNHLLQSATVPA
ncbi:Cof-type HAD-IIB family hydrolase [Pseudomonas fluorescens]|uniref:Haloacid dehalogenase n=1 Tax=Pseudomonas fluorescens TaxID=294 RepID=A0A423LBR3_PSEFL|nr:Cof-type HAD-IIB family hydrolase [Pseudomonas fluorescens]RON65742.1 haloacid dehalogenase [Pseudomonas fluorescens]